MAEQISPHLLVTQDAMRRVFKAARRILPHLSHNGMHLLVCSSVCLVLVVLLCKTNNIICRSLAVSHNCRGHFDRFQLIREGGVPTQAKLTRSILAKAKKEVFVSLDTSFFVLFAL
jgi:hypothetical protein